MKISVQMNDLIYFVYSFAIIFPASLCTGDLFYYQWIYKDRTCHIEASKIFEAVTARIKENST